MAIQKNTNDLLSQAASTLPNNTTQAISPQDVREAVENTAFSSFNKITDAALVGLKAYSTLVTYENGQACISGGAIYIANQVTSPGAFNPAHWTLYVSGSGTLNKLAKFSSTGPVTNSSITDNGTNYLLSLLSTNGFVKTSGGTGLLSVSAQVAATEGGTGKSSWVAGSIPYISATNTFNEVTAAGHDGKYLSLVAGVPTWAAVTAPNLGTANLTSADDARTFTLKSGGTSSQNLAFLNSSGKKGYYFDGSGRVGLLTSSFDNIGNVLTNLNFGDSTNKVAIGIHLDNVSFLQYFAFRMYSGSNVLLNIETRGNIQWKNQSNNANTDIQFNLGGGPARILTNTPSTSLWQVGYGHYYNGTPQVQIATDNATNGYLTVHKSDGSVTNIISGNRPYEATWFGQGLVLGGARYRAATPFFDVMGAGSTSATTTALFQNSSSVAALTIKDDLYCIFRAKDAVIPDGDLANNEMSFYIEEATNDLHFKVKFSTGTVKSGKINLT
jgi:hypothetical protein